MGDKPLVIELFAGRFGWSRGFVAEGYRSIGFDIAHEDYHGPVPDGCELVLQDVLMLHGSQFRDAACIVASPPCQRYSWMAMPWGESKREIRWQRWLRDSPFSPGFTLNDLFNACFQIRDEASKAAGRKIPLVVENVKGAQPWVGRAKAHYGSYYLWGDVEGVGDRIVASGPLRFGQPSVKAIGRRMKHNPDGTEHPVGSWFAIADSKERGARTKGNGRTWFGESHGEIFEGQPGNPVKVPSASGRRTDVGNGVRFTSRDCGMEGVKQHGSGAAWFDNGVASVGSHSSARKAASAAIAEIPFALASYIARAFKP